MSTSPYPGLRPFHRDEADIFFGRDEQVDQLLIRLGRSRFLAVVGPSGCGKSSLVHTGLLNALEAGFLADAGLHWRIATMQPGSHPMGNLAAALVEQIGPNTEILNTDTGSGLYPPLPSGEGRGEGFQKNTKSNPPSESDNSPLSNTGTSTANETPQHDDTALLVATLRRGPLGLIEALREQPLPENTNLLLVVDQFEEIFRYREHQDRDEADAFVALLLRSVQDSEFPVYIVITMRSDFLGDCALFPGLPEALNDSQFLTPRLNREQRRLAITGPARVCGGDVEPALVNRLLNDMGADPDQLPVLQHALMRLWTVAEHRGEKPVELKLNDYEALGGWDETLSRHADEAFAELDKQQQTIAEIMFRSLTERTGARRDTRRPVSLQTVADIAGVGIELVIPVIEVFRCADRSFVMPPEGQPLTAETLIDISHESLIRQWQRMKLWVEQEAESAEIYRRLEQTALLHQKKQAELYRGLELARAVDWKKREKPSAAWASRYGQEFNRAMRFLATSERRKKNRSILGAFLFLTLFSTGIYWGWLSYGKQLFNAYLVKNYQRIQNPNQEAEQITEITDLTLKLFAKRYPPREIPRGAHAKSHGCVKATFTINPDIDQELQVGLFAKPGKKFDAIIRFSNAAALVGPDIDRNGRHGSRGMAVKVFDVGGDVLIDDNNGSHNQDFLMINQPVFAFANTKDYLRLDRVLDRDNDNPDGFFVPLILKNPAISEEQRRSILSYIEAEDILEEDISRIANSLKIIRRIQDTVVANPLGSQYYSAAPFLFGPELVMKFSVKPSAEVLPTEIPEPPSDNYLREVLTETMNRNEAIVFDFMLQVRRKNDDFGIDNEFIENASTQWDVAQYPFVKVAKITIPAPQPEVDSEENKAYCEKLAFTPWHSLVEHQPIGSINRLRKSVYQASAKYRICQQRESGQDRVALGCVDQTGTSAETIMEYLMKSIDKK